MVHLIPRHLRYEASHFSVRVEYINSTCQVKSFFPLQEEDYDAQKC